MTEPAVEIANYLESLGRGKIGRTIFVHHMPEEVSAGILILDSSNGATVNGYIPGYYSGYFRVVVRENNYTDGFDLIHGITSDLTFERKTLGAVEFKKMIARYRPIVFPTSKGDLLEFSVILDATFVT